MEYLFTFIEGMASFISPCVLPLIPIYVSYFAGKENKSIKKTTINAVSFVLGFSLVFILLAILASSLGMLISENIRYIKIIFGILIILMGLNYMEIINIKFLNMTKGNNHKIKDLNFIKSFLFGIIFSISWTPCIGTFLSSALLMVAKQQELIKGIILMILYSIGLGIPFIISAILIEKLKEVFNFIKKHYNFVKKVSGIILIIMGVYMIIF